MYFIYYFKKISVRYTFWALDMLVYVRYSLKWIIFSMWAGHALRMWLTFDFVFYSQKTYIQYNDVWQYTVLFEIYFRTVITLSNQFETASLQKNVYPF